MAIERMTYGTLPKRAKFVRRVRPMIPDGYDMELVGSSVKPAIDAINQGIDSHLEAVFFEEFEAGHKLGIRIRDAGSLHTFLRRLLELDPDAYEYDPERESPPAEDLASAIMTTLDYEWV